MQKVIIYTDGGCRGNGQKENVGGYGIIMFINSEKFEFKKGFYNTTNNIMELTAIVDALRMLKEPSEVTIYSDSEYVVENVNLGHFERWKENYWRRTPKHAIKNKELWIELDKLMQIHKITFKWVKGHSGNLQNTRADQLANEIMDELQKKIILENRNLNLLQ